MTKQEILRALELAKIVYLKKKAVVWEPLQIDTVTWLEDKKTDTQAFVGTSGSDIFVVWRGTESPTDFLKDASVIKVKAFQDCKVHSGFYSCIQATKDKLFKGLDAAVKAIGGAQEVSNIYVSGHSLGGALATLSAVLIAQQYPQLTERLKVITAGSPRVGDRNFKNLFNKTIFSSIRIVHDNDIVARVPKLNYFHVNRQLKLSDTGQVMSNNLHRLKHFFRSAKANFTANSFQDHKMDNYLVAVSKWNGDLG